MKFPAIWCASGLVCEVTATKNVFTLTIHPPFKEMMNSQGEDPEEYLDRCTDAMQDALAEFMREYSDEQ